jgi:hypothetical protein
MGVKIGYKIVHMFMIGYIITWSWRSIYVTNDTFRLPEQSGWYTTIQEHNHVRVLP